MVIRHRALMFLRVTLLALLASVGLAIPAGAHVVVSGDGAEAGGFATLTFRVPNEESDASTVGVKVQLPQDHPIAFVSVQPKPGWTVRTIMRKLDPPISSHGSTITEAVSEVTWTGGKIGPGEFDEFKIQAGPLPDVATLTFKTIQTYEGAGGTTTEVAWIQEAQPGQPEPDRPAPVLTLNAASSDATGASPGASPGASASGSADGADSTSSAGDAVGSGESEPGAASAASPKKTSKASSATNGLTVFAMAFGVAGLLMAIVALITAVAARQKLSMVAHDRDSHGRDNPSQG